MDGNERLRNRTAMAITIWSSLPLLVSLIGMLRGSVTVSAGFALIALGSLGAAALARASSPRARLLGLALLVVLWLPFAIQLVRRLTYAFGPNVLAIADSPLGYMTGAVFESLFFAPLGTFAVGLWRRRHTKTCQGAVTAACMHGD